MGRLAGVQINNLIANQTEFFKNPFKGRQLYKIQGSILWALKNIK